jgi:hypothetical protein
MCSKCSSAIWGSPVAAGLLNSGMCTIALGESRVAAELDAEVPYFRYHPLRHLGASILDHANVNIGSIQRILGHENRTTTEIYLHSIGESEREAMKVFEKVWVKVPHKQQKRNYRFQKKLCNPFILLVGHVGIEPTTY